MWILLLVVLIVLLFFLALNLHKFLSFHQAFERLGIENVLHSGAPLGVSDIGSISYWMTFDYINRAFNLPPEYLKTNLHILDSRYPYLVLSRYARSQSMSNSALVTQVQKAVRDYLTTSH